MMRSHRGKICVSRELAASTPKSRADAEGFCEVYMNISKAEMTEYEKVECIQSAR